MIYDVLRSNRVVDLFSCEPEYVVFGIRSPSSSDACGSEVNE